MLTNNWLITQQIYIYIKNIFHIYGAETTCIEIFNHFWRSVFVVVPKDMPEILDLGIFGSAKCHAPNCNTGLSGNWFHSGLPCLDTAMHLKRCPNPPASSILKCALKVCLKTWRICIEISLKWQDKRTIHGCRHYRKLAMPRGNLGILCDSHKMTEENWRKQGW